MFTIICGNLSRQIKALDLLKSLLEEEFALLKLNKIDQITTIELSIHELLRQLANERDSTVRLLGGGKVLDFAQMRPLEEREELERLFAELAKAEKVTTRQSKLNAKVSLALLRQGEGLLKELTTAVAPRSLAKYSSKGVYSKDDRPDAMLISGRL